MRQILFAVLGLVAWNAASLGAEPSASTATGRWSVVPLSNAPIKTKEQYLFFAWRIDTATGSIAVCTFDPGGYAPLGGSGSKILLECTDPVAAPPTKQ